MSRARTELPGVLVEVEADDMDGVRRALAAGADWILLDNMTPDGVRACVSKIGGRVLVEVSGGITLDTIRAFAEAGPDRISVGALTHSARAVDLSLELE